MESWRKKRTESKYDKNGKLENKEDRIKIRLKWKAGEKREQNQNTTKMESWRKKRTESKWKAGEKRGQNQNKTKMESWRKKRTEPLLWTKMENKKRQNSYGKNSTIKLVEFILMNKRKCH